MDATRCASLGFGRGSWEHGMDMSRLRAMMLPAWLFVLLWSNHGHSSGAGLQCPSTPKLTAVTRCTAAPVVIDATTSTAFTAIAAYPVTIPVDNAPGVVKRLSVRVEGLTHNASHFLRLTLQGPGGRALVLRDGRAFRISPPVSGVDLEFLDEATRGSHIGSLASGRYVTTRQGFPPPAAPAPQTGYGSFLDDFAGGAANGDWRVWIDHRASRFSEVPSQGSIGRICLDIETANSAAPCEAGAPTVRSGVLDGGAPVLSDCDVPYVFETVCADARTEFPPGSVCFGVAHSRRGTLDLPNPLIGPGCVTLDLALQGCPAPTSYQFMVEDLALAAPYLTGGTVSSAGRAGATSLFLPAGAAPRLTVYQWALDMPCSGYTATLRPRPCFMVNVFKDGFEVAAP